jgi:hypothetical protein
VHDSVGVHQGKSGLGSFPEERSPINLIEKIAKSIKK